MDNTISRFDVASERSRYMMEYINRRRNEWIAQNGPCQECGSNKNLEVDHIDPTTKTIEVNHVWTRKESDRITELAKCQVLCNACHCKKTGKENTRPIVHGSISAYTRKGCRCYICRKAFSVYRKNHR